MLDEPRRLIISILCGNELINIAAVANMTGILVLLYGDAKGGIMSVAVMVPLLLLFGEITPKTIAVSNPARVSSGLVARSVQRAYSSATVRAEMKRLEADGMLMKPHTSSGRREAS